VADKLLKQLKKVDARHIMKEKRSKQSKSKSLQLNKDQLETLSLSHKMVLVIFEFSGPFQHFSDALLEMPMQAFQSLLAVYANVGSWGLNNSPSSSTCSREAQVM
jgi:hypothetical protein